jgi:hypothetical protein
MDLRPVAGCLFEVHLPVDSGRGAWSWAGGTDAVTLLAAGAGRFRFRAERAGPADLRFTSAEPGGAPVERRLAVLIAPEEG